MTSVMLDKFFAPWVDFLAPARCHGCAVACDGAPLCRSCRAALPWNANACPACALPLPTDDAGHSDACGACRGQAPPQDSAWAAFTYRAPVSQQIVALKFRGQLAPAYVLGAVMAERLARRPQPLPELLIPVPLHDARLRRRGYNQALELARQIGRRLGIPLQPGAARRVRATGEQTRLDAAARRRNVRGAFEIGAVVRNRHIALLDDVITTGATVAEAAHAARRAGAARIEVWAAARAT